MTMNNPGAGKSRLRAITKPLEERLLAVDGRRFAAGRAGDRAVHAGLDGVTGACRAFDDYLGARAGELVLFAGYGDASAFRLVNFVGEGRAHDEREGTGKNQSLHHLVPP